MPDQMLTVKNVAEPPRALSLDGGPTLETGESGQAVDNDHTRSQIANGHLLHVEDDTTPAKAPAKKPTGEKE